MSFWDQKVLKTLYFAKDVKLIRFYILWCAVTFFYNTNKNENQDTSFLKKQVTHSAWFTNFLLHLKFEKSWRTTANYSPKKMIGLRNSKEIKIAD